MRLFFVEAKCVRSVFQEHAIFRVFVYFCVFLSLLSRSHFCCKRCGRQKMNDFCSFSSVFKMEEWNCNFIAVFTQNKNISPIKLFNGKTSREKWMRTIRKFWSLFTIPLWCYSFIFFQATNFFRVETTFTVFETRWNIIICFGKLVSFFRIYRIAWQ